MSPRDVLAAYWGTIMPEPPLDVRLHAADCILAALDAAAYEVNAKGMREAVAGLFRGGFIEAGTRDPSQWGHELDRRLNPLRAFKEPGT